MWESEKERTSLPCCQGSRELETKDAGDLGSGAVSHATGGKEQPIQERHSRTVQILFNSNHISKKLLHNTVVCAVHCKSRQSCLTLCDPMN